MTDTGLKEPALNYLMVDSKTSAYFASAELHADCAKPHTLIGEYASALYELAFERCGDVLATLSPALQTEAITGKALSWSAAWNPDLAQLERLLVSQVSPELMVEMLAPMLVRLGAEGILSQADITLQQPKILFWDTISLPEADRIIFKTYDKTAEIRLFKQKEAIATLELKQLSNGLWHSEIAKSIGFVWLDKYPIRLWTEKDAKGYPYPAKRQPYPNALPHVTHVMQEAADLMNEHTPHFVPWVADGIRNIVALDASDGIRMSASVEEFPALTFLSFPAPAVEMAETLIHEASHHHFLALQRLTALHDGTDTKEYYSPIKLKGRPIELILYAFHAFANAAIYHRNLCRAIPEFYRLNGRTLDESLERIRVLDGYLSETRALTEAGHTLWKPLATALFEG